MANKKKKDENIAEQILLEEIVPPKEEKKAPKKETPKKETPKKETPKKETPKKETSKKETPKKETPKKETPKKETPKKETPKKETPKKETPKKETPKKETSKKETPKKETPKKETPKKETPKKETSKNETLKKETPKKETPKKETSKKETPKKETPKKETSKKETPKKETPKKETPQKETKAKAEKEEKSVPAKKPRGFLDTTPSKKKLLDDAFADIENQLKAPLPEKSKETPKKETKSEAEKKPEPTAQKKVEPKSKIKKKAEPKVESNSKATSETNTLPSKARLQDLKGEKIEEFIESVSEQDVTYDDETKASSKNLRKLPEVLSHIVPVQGDSVTEIVRKGLIVISVILLLVSMVVLIKTTRGNGNDTESKVGILEEYVTEYAVNKKSSTMPQGILEKYYSIYNVNNDTAGWIILPGTSIDLPVVKYTDNEYYATRNFYGKQLTALSAYADCNCNLQELGNISTVYIAKGSAVTSIDGLGSYVPGQSSDFEISFSTLYDEYVWKILYCSINTVDEVKATNFQAMTMSDIISYMSQNTAYDPLVFSGLTSGDKLLVLVAPYVSEDGAQQSLVIISRLENQQKN